MKGNWWIVTAVLALVLWPIVGTVLTKQFHLLSGGRVVFLSAVIAGVLGRGVVWVLMKASRARSRDY